MTIDRRGLLGLLGFGAAGSAVAQDITRTPLAAFNHGVASGDPLHDRVILWTRVTADAPTPLVWEVSKTADFVKPVATGSVTAFPERDYTAKVDVGGLKAGQDYFYRFRVAQGDGFADSPVGRTRTLPKGSPKEVVLAVCTCALYPNGYFNAYGAIAALARVDAVVHLGDYIYEYGGPNTYGMTSAVAHERPHDPAHDCVGLTDYRRRHAQYKTDPQLQAAHARAPWIVVWDDHETANDSWTGGAQNHNPATEGDWNQRKAAAIRAYYEWMPIREPEGGGFSINRSFNFGDLATLFMLETRLTARDQQLTYARDLPKNPSAADVAAFRAKLEDTSRKMMSEAQEAWLRTGLRSSVASGRRWQVLGNEVVMARITTPPVRELMGQAAYAQATSRMTKAAVERLGGMDRMAALGLPVGLDQWDGYPADRDRLYKMLSESHANAIVLSGDSHAFWANELYDGRTGGERVAVEFGTAGITSPGAGDAMPTIPMGSLVTRHNREVHFSDHAAKGFVLLTLTRDEARAELMAVSTIVDRQYGTSILRAFRVKNSANGVAGLEEISGAQTPA
jgi:alkaline phosphatase D